MNFIFHSATDFIFVKHGSDYKAFIGFHWSEVPWRASLSKQNANDWFESLGRGKRTDKKNRAQIRGIFGVVYGDQREARTAGNGVGRRLLGEEENWLGRR